MIDLLNGVKNGWIPPDFVSEEEYKYIKNHKDKNPILTGFIGFGCSFGGKWFAGYAKNQTNRNYALEAKNSLLADMATLIEAEFTCQDYRDVELPEGCVVYCDPPYENTTGYNHQKFDSESFWEYAREISKTHLVYISEQSAPADFISIWEKPVTRTLDVNKQNYFKAVEKLFVHSSNAEYINENKIKGVN